MRVMLALGAAVVLAACGGGSTGPSSSTIPSTGPSTAPPSIAATTLGTASASAGAATPTPTEATMPSPDFVLTSTAFQEGGAIPRKFTCDGENVSPAVAWSGAPDDAQALALIVDDPDAKGFVHWVVFNMTGSQSGALPEAASASPDAPPQGENGFRKIGYGGPCPPSGTHHYRFTLLALDAPLDLTGTPTADEVRHAAEGHVVGQAVLTATYRRGG